MKPWLIAYLLPGSEHICWILDLKDEVHSIWNLWISGLQECKSNDFSRIRAGQATISNRVQKHIQKNSKGLPRPGSDTP